MAPIRFLSGCLMICLLSRSSVQADSWPQFRGIGGAGHYASDLPLPTQLGPNQNVLWKVPLPPGHASPLLTDKRIFLAAVKG